MARKPSPGGDDGIWGSILNDYLDVVHDADGNLKPNTVAAAQIQNGSLPESKLDTSVQAKLNAVSTIADGSVTEAKLDGAVQTKLNAAPVVADGSITSAKIAASAPVGGQVLSFNGTGFSWVMPVSGVTDHGALSGLADDDHPQYHTDARGDARYYTQAQVTSALSTKANTSHAHAIADVTNLQASLNAKADTSHAHTKADVGLANVDNTSDTAKPVSTATQTALNAKLNASEKGAINGVATLDASGLVPSSQLPSQAAGTLDNLSDVTVVGATDGQSLVYQSGTWIPATVSAGGVTDHGALTGLSDDDHPQYFNTTRGDARYYTQAQVDSSLSAKANDNAVVHLAGAETISGVKTYSSSPIVPTPTTATQAVTKGYVDTAVASVVVADGSITTSKIADNAVTDVKVASISQAKVTGLAASLAAKADTSHTHVSANITDINEAVEDIIGSRVIAGSNVTVNYNDTTGQTTVSAATQTGTTNLTSSTAASTVTVLSDTGTDATLAAATTTNAGVLSAADKTKLDGVATGATANSSDATLLNRANHTGTQAQSTVTNLSTDLAAKLTNPMTTQGDIIYADAGAVPTRLAGVATGNALISGGVGANPSWGKVALTTHISGNLPVGNGGTGRNTSTTAYGVIAAGTTATGAQQTIAPGTAGQILKSNGTAALASFQTGVPADVGLGNVNNTSDANKPISTATQTALNAKADSVHAHTNYVDKTGPNIVTLPDSATQFVRVNIPDDLSPTAGWPDRYANYFDGTRTGYFNEYGEVRARPAKTNTVAMRVMSHTSGSSVDVFQVTHNTGSPVYMGVSQTAASLSVPLTSTQNIVAPNIGSSRVFASPTAIEPTGPRNVGDVWIKY